LVFNLPRISWTDRRKDFLPTYEIFAGCTFCVDGTECWIPKQQGKEIQKAFWSHKSQKCCLRYEVCTQISSGRIIWATSPHRGAKADKIVFREYGLLDLVRRCREKGKGYYVKEWFNTLMVPTSSGILKRALTRNEMIMNRVISSVRVLTERTNGLLKYWRILDDMYRGELSRHQAYFYATHQILNWYFSRKL
jgi:hypothetical protein